MSLRRFLPWLLLVLAMPSLAAEPARVSAAQLIAAGRDALAAKAAQAGVAAEFHAVGRVQELALPVDGDATVSVGEWKGPWLRPRVGVPVQVRAGDRLRTTVTVWFAVSASMAGAVYASDYPRGASAAAVAHRAGRIDLARTNGQGAIDTAALPGQRLRRAVRAGDPVLASDFEKAPMVSAQQSVRIDVAQGSVHLTVAGRALVDGDQGETISVLPAHASQPVRARIVSSQVVTLEN